MNRMPQFSRCKPILKRLALVSPCLLFLFGCHPHKATASAVLAVCDKPKAERNFTGGASSRSLDTANYQDLLQSAQQVCGSCHANGQASGGFTFDESTFAGVADAMFAQLKSGSMPPDRKPEDAFLTTLERKWTAWNAGGKSLTEAFGYESLDPKGPFAPDLADFTDLGDCEVNADAALDDAHLTAEDSAWLTAEKLPNLLSQTDLKSFRSTDLARSRVYSYNVEYPLVSGDAMKMRLIRVPVGQVINFNPLTQAFEIPDGTRFYKTFLKPFTSTDGSKVYRRIETRVIVVRKKSGALYGVYKWNQDGTEAVLESEPYRNGEGWRDEILTLTTDDNQPGASEPYLIPGKQRCQECHQGSESDSFVLGFTPLQLNRRLEGQGGGSGHPRDYELSQLDRLIKLKVVTPAVKDAILPLEKRGLRAPPNEFALKAQAYMIGNCTHCHSPRGLALQDENVRYDFSPGKLFPFEDPMTSTGLITTIPFSVSELNAMPIYARMTMNDAKISNGVYKRVLMPMPVHTFGKPDCDGITTIGQWLLSYNNPDYAKNWAPDCAAFEPRLPLAYDITLPDSNPYKPRRSDWADAASGMKPYEAIADTVSLEAGWNQITEREYPVQFWKNSPECKFPKRESPAAFPAWYTPANQRDPQGFSWDHVYFERPGHFFFRKVCSSCHGRKGEADTGMALYLFKLSQGSIIPANFKTGLFEASHTHLKAFDTPGDNGTTENKAFAYLLWMTSEGTKFDFKSAADLGDYLGSNYKNMLYKIQNDFCAPLVNKKHGAVDDPATLINGYEIFSPVCTLGNPITDDIIASKFGTQKSLYQDWLKRGAFNAAFTIFKFLRDDAYSDDPNRRFQPFPDYCAEKFAG